MVLKTEIFLKHYCLKDLSSINIFSFRNNFEERKCIKQKQDPGEFDPELRRKKILALKVEIAILIILS